MIESGFSYRDLSRMDYGELKFWVERFVEFKRKTMEDA